MFQEHDMVAFVATAKPEAAREFYVNVLGLELVRDEGPAIVFQGNGRTLRMQKVERVPPPVGTVLGWEVDDIAAMAGALEARGVSLQRYDGLPQDDAGIATFPGGDRVAWFLDPDGNILSMAQMARRD